MTVLHVVDDASVARFSPDAWGRAVMDTIIALRPVAMVAPGTDRGNEVMARVASRLDLPMAANCVEVRPGPPFEVTRLRWGGSLLEDAALEADIKLITVAPHAVQPEAVPAPAPAAVHPLPAPLDPPDLRVRPVDEGVAVSKGVSLADARVVVGGGRGVGSPEGFRALEELADLLGGVVGCSRVITSLGWRPHTDQVGQTGTRIAPDLYIACGISGATQHMVGCRAAKRILVINTDPDAPIVAQADYAVIGDVSQVVPAISREIRARSG
jgi:electron transfer flavoprotein alpha subunit